MRAVVSFCAVLVFAATDDAYYDVRLEMSPIWTDRDDGHWLYVEQAVAGREDAPYRQRVYRVTAGEAPLATLTPDSLRRRSGCAIVLRKDEE